MYTRPRKRDRSDLLDLDSLMDILSCLVGVMLFLVIYTVLELGSAAYEAEVPVVRGVPPGSDPIVFIAEEGTLRPIDVRAPLRSLLSGFEIVRSIDVPIFVDQANERPVRDGFFSYSLTYDQRFRVFGDPLGTLALVIDEVEGAVGDSLHQIDGASDYAALLGDLDPAEHWLAFEVDSTGVDVFRRARELALEGGFTVQWRPKEIRFPFSHTLAGGSPTDIMRSRESALDKPQR